MIEINTAKLKCRIYLAISGIIIISIIIIIIILKALYIGDHHKASKTEAVKYKPHMTHLKF